MSLARYLTAIDNALIDLGRSTADRDGDGTWIATRTALGWLYDTEEAAKKLISDYYDVRVQSKAGRTLAGLMYIRGLAVHHQAETREEGSKAPTYVRAEGAWKEVEMKVRRDGGWQPAVTQIRRARWPPLADLPMPGRREVHGRDQAYDKEVAGQPIADPLRAAREFLGSLASATRD